MLDRREFLRVGGGALGAGALGVRSGGGLDEVLAASARVADQSAQEIARNEMYWRDIQQAFTLDRTLINLNNATAVRRRAWSTKPSSGTWT